MALLEIVGISKRFGATAAVDDVSLSVERGAFYALLGPSGCGKTTLLRMIAGLEAPDSGRIVIDGADVTELPPYARPVNMMFQSYALFPHMDVARNIAFGLRQEGMDRRRIAGRVEEMLALVQMEGYERRRPYQLSGGQRQRVALGRAIVRHPQVFLFDEPLSNLDALLRDEMRVELKRLQERLGITMIFVTHDQAEALVLSDRVVVMEAGRVEQIGRPEEVYRRPATAFVARFLGRANFLAGTVAESGPTGIVVALDGDRFQVVAVPRSGLGAGQRVHAVIRQEAIRLEPAEGAAQRPNNFAATVVFHAFAGQTHHYVMELADGRELEVATPGAAAPLARGDHTPVAWSPDDVILLPAGPPTPGDAW